MGPEKIEMFISSSKAERSRETCWRPRASPVSYRPLGRGRQEDLNDGEDDRKTA